MTDTKIGAVVHFYDKISVAIVKLDQPVKVGDTLKFKHADQEFTQPLTSMQIKHESIDAAKKGDEVGIKVDQPVKPKTQVYTVA